MKIIVNNGDPIVWAPKVGELFVHETKSRARKRADRSEIKRVIVIIDCDPL